jgi:hypothetical protein
MANHRTGIKCLTWKFYRRGESWERSGRLAQEEQQRIWGGQDTAEKKEPEPRRKVERAKDKAPRVKPRDKSRERKGRKRRRRSSSSTPVKDRDADPRDKPGGGPGSSGDGGGDKTRMISSLFEIALQQVLRS